MAKPGVMFYFDIRPCIRRLTLEEKGRLFEAILDYGEFGLIPEVDGTVGIAWDFIQPKLDRDSSRYDRQVEQKQYAVFMREVKKKDATPISFSEWKDLSENERNRLLSDDNERHPTNNPQPTTNNPQPTKDNIMGADKPPKRSRFVPPTVDEIRAYCAEKGYSVDPERFINHYTSNGWRVGKTPMVDWKASVRTWVGNDNQKAKNTGRSGAALDMTKTDLDGLF